MGSGKSIARLPEQVTQAIERIAAASVEESRARYELGRVLHRFRYPNGAVASGRMGDLAKALGVDASALHRCARVSEVIPPEEFDSIVRLRTDRGMPLAWSDIERIARERCLE